MCHAFKSFQICPQPIRSIGQWENGIDFSIWKLALVSHHSFVEGLARLNVLYYHFQVPMGPLAPQWLLSCAQVAANDSLAPLFENDSLSSKRKESLGSRYLNDIIEFWIFLIEFVQIFLVSIFICPNNKIHFEVWRLISTIGQHIISNSASNFEILQPRFYEEKMLYSVSKSEKSKMTGVKMAVFRKSSRSTTESDDFAWARPAI